MTQVDSPPPPPLFFFFFLSVTFVARFSVLCCGGFSLSSPSGLLYVFISDPRRGCYIVLSMFIFFSSFFFFFSFSFFCFPPRFCPAHISGTVTRRDSKFSVLLGPAV